MCSTWEGRQTQNQTRKAKRGATLQSVPMSKHTFVAAPRRVCAWHGGDREQILPGKTGNFVLSATLLICLTMGLPRHLPYACPHNFRMKRDDLGSHQPNHSCWWCLHANASTVKLARCSKPCALSSTWHKQENH